MTRLFLLLALAVTVALCTVLFPLFLLLESIVCLASLAAVYQERKIWLHPKVPSLTPIGMTKVFVLNVVWMTVCGLGAVATALEAAVTNHWLELGHTRKLAHMVVERKCAMLVAKLIVGPVIVEGAENLPADYPDSPAPVYVANHASQIDSAVVYFIEKQWRWIMKSSIMFLPGVGQITYLGDHIWIDRSRTKSKGTSSKGSITGARNLYVKSDASIQEGTPMFFFPQGTRRMGERLPFKDGAFKVAKNNDSQLVPISINVPVTAWNSLYPFAAAEPVVLTVHKPIDSKGKEIETLKKECSEVIYSVLPDYSKED
mmetsp:Transcript_2640/g.5527  ORF Transcript_2640/g.5527 Transcript_2640/m.5527 type:complete len:315 (-) Transcript_2640:93-1037(-)